MLVLPQELTQSQASACLTLLRQGLRAQSGPEVVVDATASVSYTHLTLPTIYSV